MILITTSHRPTRPMRTLSRDLARSIPDLKYVNRGKNNLNKFVGFPSNNRERKLVIIERWKKGFSKLNLIRIQEKALVLVISLFIRSVRFQREFGIRKPIGLSLQVEADEILPEKRVNLLKCISRFFNLPIISLNKASDKLTKSIRLVEEDQDCISLTFYILPEGTEVGPRLRISKVVWGNE